MDDLFGLGATDSGVTANPFSGLAPSAATGGPDAQPQSSSEPQQFGSRREARAAASPSTPRPRTPSVSRPQERAATRRSRLSRPSTDRRAVARAAREIDEHQPRSRKLRRSDIRVMHAAAPQGQRKNPLRALATMGIVGGLFAVVGLPAYAMVPTAATTESNDALSTQSMVVSADATVLSAVRDGYHATTAEEIAEASQDEIRAQNQSEYLLSGARELGDDYPWPYELSEDQGAGLSPLNYYYRQCTDFVAWRLNRDAGAYATPFKWVWSNLTPLGGNASQWEYAWEQHGWTVSTTPVVGSVAWFGWSNHVAYVKSVNADGTVTVEEYNYVPNVYSQRTIPATSVESFLYPPS